MAKTYAANRRKRQFENRKGPEVGSRAVNYGEPIAGDKSSATLARATRRKNVRVRNAQQTSMLNRLKADKAALEANEKRVAPVIVTETTS